jgi:hypothetical protein
MRAVPAGGQAWPASDLRHIAMLKVKMTMKMMTNLLAVSGAALLTAAISAGPAHATQLMGDHLRVSWGLPNTSTRYAGFAIGGSSLYSFHVVNGVEATAYLNPGGRFMIDVADTSLTLTFLNAMTFVPQTFNGLIFEQLDGSAFPTLVGTQGITAGAINATANKLFVNLRGLQYQTGDQVMLEFASGVPEPATWGTMLVGMAAIGFALRRRPRTSVSFS